MFTTFVKINVAKTPHNIPRGTPISPNISPSSITLFFIWFFVAPTLESIPYILIFSVVEIANEFLIQKMLTATMIEITTLITAIIILLVVSEKANASHINN